MKMETLKVSLDEAFKTANEVKELLGRLKSEIGNFNFNNLKLKEIGESFTKSIDFHTSALEKINNLIDLFSNLETTKLMDKFEKLSSDIATINSTFEETINNFFVNKFPELEKNTKSYLEDISNLIDAKFSNTITLISGIENDINDISNFINEKLTNQISNFKEEIAQKLEDFKVNLQNLEIEHQNITQETLIELKEVTLKKFEEIDKKIEFLEKRFENEQKNSKFFFWVFLILLLVAMFLSLNTFIQISKFS